MLLLWLSILLITLVNRSGLWVHSHMNTLNSKPSSSGLNPTTVSSWLHGKQHRVWVFCHSDVRLTENRILQENAPTGNVPDQYSVFVMAAVFETTVAFSGWLSVSSFFSFLPASRSVEVVLAADNCFSPTSTKATVFLTVWCEIPQQMASVIASRT